MQNYTYSPPLNHGDPYRQAGSMPTVQPVNLPPLRFDGHIQHNQSYSQHQHTQMPSPPMTGYYSQPQPVMYHNQHLSHMPQGPYRPFGIPISHTRTNKKEIKRRTKTGCMTCRKRRIKCDEQKPVCKNCVKSKRECQGYDPLYKNQPGNGSVQQQRKSNPSTACCTPKPSHSQRPISPPASIHSASTTTVSSPTTTIAGITTPSSASSFCSSTSSAGSMVSSASYAHPTYSNASLSHTYSTAPVSQNYPATPISQAYPATPVSHSYSAAPMTHSYSTASLPQYSTPSMSQPFTLPSPLSSSRHSPIPSYYSANTSVESLNAVNSGRSLPSMTRAIHGMAIY